MELLSNAENIEELIRKNQMVLLYFSNETCGVCRVLKPKIEQLILQYPQLKSGFVDVDKSLEVAVANHIFSLPAILIFAEGKEIIREARHISIRDLEKRLNRYYQLLFG